MAHVRDVVIFNQIREENLIDWRTVKTKRMVRMGRNATNRKTTLIVVRDGYKYAQPRLVYKMGTNDTYEIDGRKVTIVGGTHGVPRV